MYRKSPLLTRRTLPTCLAQSRVSLVLFQKTMARYEKTGEMEDLVLTCQMAGNHQRHTLHNAASTSEQMGESRLGSLYSSHRSWTPQ